MDNKTVVHRLMTDPSFVATLSSDPGAAQETYDLPTDVVDAIESGDETQIRSVLSMEYGAGVPNQGPTERT